MQFPGDAAKRVLTWPGDSSTDGDKSKLPILMSSKTLNCQNRAAQCDQQLLQKRENDPSNNSHIPPHLLEQNVLGAV